MKMNSGMNASFVLRSTPEERVVFVNLSPQTRLGRRDACPTMAAHVIGVAPGWYVFTVGSAGDSPVPSGDPPDGTDGGIERNNGVFTHPGFTNRPPGGSPGGAGGSPAPPSVNRYPVGRERVRVILFEIRLLAGWILSLAMTAY